MDRGLINRAIHQLQMQLKEPEALLKGADDAKALAILKLGALDIEHFGVLLLNSQNGLIEYRTLFMGTLDSCPVYPREILKAVLNSNARSIILAHNHPSGCTDPSDADMTITQRIVNACGVIDVSVLDHIIVGGAKAISFEEKGIMPRKQII